MRTMIYMIRHGETNWNKERRFQGQMDIPLNEKGKLQATNIAKRFIEETLKIDAVYSSDLKRAKETAEEVAAKHQLEVVVNAGLRERHFGLLEGKKFEELNKVYPELHMGNLEQFESLNVEAFQLLQTRMVNTVKELCKHHMGQNIVIVSHGAAINSFLHGITIGELGTGKTKLSNTSVSIVVYDHKDDRWEVIKVNDDIHNNSLI